MSLILYDAIDVCGAFQLQRGLPTREKRHEANALQSRRVGFLRRVSMPATHEANCFLQTLKEDGLAHRKTTGQLDK
jgi:hypothetical protein